VVTGTDHMGDVVGLLGSGKDFGCEFTYRVQDEAGGIAQALGLARRFGRGGRLAVILGDNIFEASIAGFADEFRRQKSGAKILVQEVPDPGRYGVAVTQGDKVVRIIEKPKDPPSSLAVTGVYCYDEAVFDVIASLKPSARGELEITDAIQHLVDSGMRVDPHIVEGWWKDTGRLEDMLAANRLVLDTITTRMDGELVDSQVEGRVIVEAGARLERSSVRGPAIIGAGAHLTDAYVGPYTAIGEHCVIVDAEVEHSILLSGSEVRGLDGRMESSLLGRNVKIGRGERQPRAYRFMVGDNCEIGIP
jgi:glucose-1-phosphate thymidylyltransferase